MSVSRSEAVIRLGSRAFSKIDIAADGMTPWIRAIVAFRDVDAQRLLREEHGLTLSCRRCTACCTATG